MSWTADELAGFVDTDDFGRAVTWTPGFGAASSINAIFDNAHVKQLDEFGGVASVGPAVTVKSSDVTGIAPGETITVGSDEYYVMDIQPDGNGLTVITLSKDPAK